MGVRNPIIPVLILTKKNIGAYGGEGNQLWFSSIYSLDKMHWLPNYAVRKRRNVTHFFQHSQFSPYFFLYSFGLWSKRSMKSLHALSCLRTWGCRCPWERHLHGVLPCSYFIFHSGNHFAPPWCLHQGHSAGLCCKESSSHLQGTGHPPSFWHLLSSAVVPLDCLFVLTSPAHMQTSITQAATLVPTNPLSNKWHFGPQALK